MPDLIEPRPELKRKKGEIETFLGTLWTSAKTTGLYKPGHPMLMQICDRVAQLLVKTLGQETTLTLDVKAKNVSVEDLELQETPDIMAFASSLHTLGIGQVLLTNRLSKEGVYEFCRVLIAKPDEKTSLTELQKTVQSARIDGMQLSFILSFVVTGDTEEKAQTPGQLSEEQIQAFIKAQTLPDYLTLLLHQNEALAGKAAETVTSLLDGALYRDAPLERLEAEMPWDLYDPRIRKRWDEFRALMRWGPRKTAGGRGPRRAAEGVVSWASLYEDADVKALKDHHSHEKKEALAYALADVHELLDAPRTPSQLKYAVYAYVRLLSELGRDGAIDALLKEYRRWQEMAGKQELASLFGFLQKEIQEKVATPAFAEQLVAYLGRAADGSPESALLAEVSVFMGSSFIPRLLEQLRGVADKAHRAKLCSFLARLCKATGVETLVPALQDEDWFLAANVVAILQEIADPAHAAHVAPLLKHKHPKVREPALRFLGKFGGEAAIEAMGGFIASSDDLEQVGKAVIALSLLSGEGIAPHLCAAYRKTAHYETRVAVARALGRQPSAASLEVLKEAARRTWSEVLFGRKKELHQAAVHSLEQLRKEGHA